MVGSRDTDWKAGCERCVLPDGGGGVLVMVGRNRPDGPGVERQREVVVCNGHWCASMVGVRRTIWQKRCSDSGARDWKGRGESVGQTQRMIGVCELTVRKLFGEVCMAPEEAIFESL